MKHHRRPHHRHKARACAPWPAAPPPPWQGPPPAAPSCGSHSGRHGRSRSGTPSACRAQSRGALPRGACVAGRGRRVVSAGSGRGGACQWPSKSRGQGPDAPPVSDPSSVLSHPTRARAVHRLRALDARAEQTVAAASSGCAHTATHAERMHSHACVAVCTIRVRLRPQFGCGRDGRE
jgi:hypothetical protein